MELKCFLNNKLHYIRALEDFLIENEKLEDRFTWKTIEETAVASTKGKQNRFFYFSFKGGLKEQIFSTRRFNQVFVIEYASKEELNQISSFYRLSRKLKDTALRLHFLSLQSTREIQNLLKQSLLDPQELTNYTKTPITRLLFTASGEKEKEEFINICKEFHCDTLKYHPIYPAKENENSFLEKEEILIEAQLNNKCLSCFISSFKEENLNFEKLLLQNCEKISI